MCCTMTIISGSGWKLLCSEVSPISPSSGTELRNILCSQNKSLESHFFHSSIIFMRSSKWQLLPPKSMAFRFLNIIGVFLSTHALTFSFQKHLRYLSVVEPHYCKWHLAAPFSESWAGQINPGHVSHPGLLAFLSTSQIIKIWGVHPAKHHC